MIFTVNVLKFIPSHCSFPPQKNAPFFLCIYSNLSTLNYIFIFLINRLIKLSSLKKVLFYKNLTSHHFCNFLTGKIVLRI